MVENNDISYEVIHFDSYKGCNLESASEDKVLFQRVRALWMRWNRNECRPRVLVVNAYLPGHEIEERPIFQAAAMVFGRNRMAIHSNEIFTVSSPERSQ